MKTRTLLRNLQELLDPDTRKKKFKRKQLRDLLVRLKKRQHKLEEKRADTDDKSQRRKLKNEIQVIREQRRKGIRLCRSLNRTS